MDENEFAPEEISDFSLKDGSDETDVAIDEEYEVDPNEDVYNKAFPKEGEDTLFAQDDDAKEIFDIFAQEYDER